MKAAGTYNPLWANKCLSSLEMSIQNPNYNVKMCSVNVWSSVVLSPDNFDNLPKPNWCLIAVLPNYTSCCTVRSIKVTQGWDFFVAWFSRFKCQSINQYISTETGRKDVSSSYLCLVRIHRGPFAVVSPSPSFPPFPGPPLFLLSPLLSLFLLPPFLA